MVEKSTFRMPEHGRCFICGPNSGSGLDVEYSLVQGEIHTEVVLDERHQGPPQHAHGGVLLAILDEAMGASAWAQGHPVLAAHVEMDFRRPVPLGEKIRICARIVEQKGRKIFTEGEVLLPSGDVAATAKGIFIEHKPFFEEMAQKHNLSRPWAPVEE